MRGTPFSFRSDRPDRGIIPAYAGNTWRLSRIGYRLRDHPRVCGEHFSGTLTPYPLTGSSPRMRGTQAFNIDEDSPVGIIPAYAGNTT